MTAERSSVRVGISSCLLGEHVRFDCGHKRDPFLTEVLGRFVEWVPVCPEVECGLGTPRESMRLVGGTDGPRLLTVRTHVDHTPAMAAFSRRRVEELTLEDLSGYVLKKDSPTCGLERVKVYGTGGVPLKSGRGLFATALLERFPLLPVEEEGRLSDPALRDNFVERVFAYWHLRRLFHKRWSIGSLVSFHTAYKLTLMAHSPEAYRALGRAVATARQSTRQEVQRSYSEAFMRALSIRATRSRHTNVLQHIAGYFKDSLDRDSRAELVATIQEYRRGLVPLAVPLTLLRHYVRRDQVSYLAGQTYVEPQPRDLVLACSA